MNLKVIPYKLYVFTSANTSDSKVLGALSDALHRLRSKEELCATQAFFEANANRVERVASLLADAQSREAYRSLIQYRCHRERRYINPHMQPKRSSYLDKALIVPGPSEVFIDIGAFQGMSSLLFQEACLAAGQPAPQCVLFEPDPFNFTRLQKNLSKFIQEPLRFQMGLGRERGQVHFRPGAFSMSKIEPSGQGVIEVDTLEHVLAGMPELPPVTYIKIDVEGADLDVLYGARETIRKYRPRIAISIYHSNAHMIEIPEALHEICPEYRFYVRHYSCLDGETVLYCV